MDMIQQAKAKIKPPPPPPKPSHLSRSTASSRSQPTHKRGLGWPWDFKPELFPLFVSPSSEKGHHRQPISWLFNWELWVPPGLPPSVEWVPCVRTAAQCKDIVPFLTDITTNQGRVISNLLGFNEPEIPSQANLGVDEAVRLWKDVVLPAKRIFGFRLGSPGMSSDVGRSVGWLDEFFAKLRAEGTATETGAGVDFLVLHWYGPHFVDMRSFLEMMHEKYRLPVWVNEFACSTMGQGKAASQDNVEAFLREAIPWLEKCEWVEKYAYFGNGQGLDVGSWVGGANNFIEQGGRRLSKTGHLYLDL